MRKMACAMLGHRWSAWSRANNAWAIFDPEETQTWKMQRTCERCSTTQTGRLL